MLNLTYIILSFEDVFGRDAEDFTEFWDVLLQGTIFDIGLVEVLTTATEFGGQFVNSQNAMLEHGDLEFGFVNFEFHNYSFQSR